MLNYYYQLQDKLNAFSFREQLMILLGSCVLIYLIWFSVFWEPLQQDKQKLMQNTKTITQQRSAKALEISSLNNKLKEVKTRREAQFKRHQENADRLKLEQGGLLTGKTSAEAALRNVLTPTNDLKLIKLESTNKTGNKLKQDVVLQLEGPYFSLLNYLIRLERMNWSLLWESLTYKVNTYPNADITIALSIPDIQKNG